MLVWEPGPGAGDALDVDTFSHQKYNDMLG